MLGVCKYEIKCDSLDLWIPVCLKSEVIYFQVELPRELGGIWRENCGLSFFFFEKQLVSFAPIDSCVEVRLKYLLCNMVVVMRSGYCDV